ncbi:metallophosphoesterase [Anaerotignum sp. MB30-C6]|uniref:metallophosphoesterase n=1 Tax=Anaerotignum sp. MB30-C6 TaxID=3070814 RepID=UPI0027DB79E4|nr:metallophosphoesterase [Anaerotignum sp. MB30-C6]WMI80400.1 metallophosphoesterase [Anaerotignum sp. MB30-C6]
MLHKRLKKKRIWLIFILLCILLFFLAFDVRLKTVTYTINTEKLTDQIRIALVTDLHSCRYGDDQENLIQAIEKENPDLILLGGDICDDRIPHNNTQKLLKSITKKYPCYYVTGNHEYWTGDIEKVLDIFRAYNVNILQGTFETIEVNGQKLNICGIDDPDAERWGTNISIAQQLEALKSTSENGFYTVLLSHRPELIETYLEYNFDLILSGHAHGGQWRIPGILNGLLAPNQGWFPPYAGGEYSFDNSKMIVSRGLARESTRVPRIFNRPELVIVNLK